MTPHATQGDIVRAMAEAISSVRRIGSEEARILALAALRPLGEHELLRLASHAGSREHIGRDGIRRSPPGDGQAPF